MATARGAAASLTELPAVVAPYTRSLTIHRPAGPERPHGSCAQLDLELVD